MRSATIPCPIAPIMAPVTEPEENLTHEIVARIQQGDVAAWESLWSRLHDDLLFVVRCRLGRGLRQHLESEDILQSMVRDAIGEIATFKPRDGGTLRGLLSLMVTRKIKTRAASFATAKRSGTVPLVNDVPSPGSEPRYSEPARYEALETAMLRLEGPEREIVLMHRVEGVPSREIAQRTGQSDASVRKQYSRALVKLRAWMDAPRSKSSHDED